MRHIRLGLASGIMALLAACASAETVPTPAAADAAPPERVYTTMGAATGFKTGAPTILITGANRGIGLEFVTQLKDGGWNIIATARNPADASELVALGDGYPQLVVEELDVTDFERIEQLSAKYADVKLDVLLSNAGITPKYKSAFQRAEKIDWDMAQLSYEVNAMAPLKLSSAFLDQVAASDQKKIVVISSKAGSFELSPKLPMMYSYRASKAALNMFIYTMSFETAKKGVTLTLLSPGQVNTTPGMKLPGAIEPPESVSKMLAVIANLTPANNGQFLDFEDGRSLGW